jgi:hypothetical protein
MGEGEGVVEMKEPWVFKGTAWDSKTPTIIKVRISYPSDGVEKVFERPYPLDLDFCNDQPKRKLHESDFDYYDRLATWWKITRTAESMPNWAERKGD